MAGIEDNKDKNIEMAETESLWDMEKPIAEDASRKDSSEITIKQISETFSNKIMEVSTTFILYLFVCCTIAQTTYITSKGAAVSKILVPSSSVRSATVLPLTVTTKPKLPSTSTPTTVPSLAANTTTVLPLTVTPKPKPPSTSTPTTVPSSATNTTIVLPSTVTLKPKPQSTLTPTTMPSSAANTTTVHVLPSTVTPIIVPTTKTLFLEFKCAANGVITEISGVDKGEVVLLNGSKYCHLNEPNCDWKNKSKLNVLHVKGENSSNIAGGKNAHFYQLECKTAGAFVATANTSMQMAIPAPTDFSQEIKKPTEPSKTIRLVITDIKGTPATTVHIGDPLLLKITGPAGYTIEPISCNASSSVDTDYVMWTNDSCSSKDTAVIENAWKYNKTIPNIVSISMYGFRFVKSNTVVITCSALFCPKGMQCSSKAESSFIIQELRQGDTSCRVYRICSGGTMNNS
ncbi:uncharacterized protein [Mytilus edulis]|uniref:uncharacterized protein n=1 Tax=Mytilus edulis TaxID=6550 RepID=UPI0039EFED00